MVIDFEEAIAAFVAMPETRQTAQPKELNTTSINRKELNTTNINRKELNTTNINRKGAPPHRKIGLPLNSVFL